MKLKATLIAAATLAVGVISSQAQVYSQNIVGYVNIPLTNGVLANVAPTLDFDGTGTNNTISTVFTTPHTNDTVYAFNGTGYDTLVYKVLGSGHPVVYTTNWFKGSLASPNYSLNPGQSVFYLPAANQTNTQVGTVLTGASLVNSVFPAANKVALVSSQVPIAGGLTSVLGYKPSINDVVYVYNGAGYNTYTYKVLGTGHPVVYSTNWFQGSLAGEPAINVGQGFWIQPSQNTNWVQSFTP
jgi:hypothetical protein